jgi:hypothetical protein
MTSKSAPDVDFLGCTLPSSELATRRAEIQSLFEQVGSVEATSDGVLFRFQNTGEVAHALVDFIQFEQQCCGAITYELRSEPPHTVFTLQLRAPETLIGSIQTFYLTNKPPVNDGKA